MSSIFPRQAMAGTARVFTAFLLCAVFSLQPAASQTSTPPAAAPKVPADKSTGMPKANPSDTRVADGSDTLEKLNGALESLAARVSPAVVQILVTGYGPLREE